MGRQYFSQDAIEREARRLARRSKCLVAESLQFPDSKEHQRQIEEAIEWLESENRKIVREVLPHFLRQLGNARLRD